MYIPKEINVIEVHTKEDIARAVNSNSLAIYIPKECCNDIFGYIKNTAISKSKDRKSGKRLFTLGAIGTIAAWSMVSIAGLIAAPIIAIVGIGHLLSSIDSLNKYHIAFMEDGSIGLFYTDSINFIQDTFTSHFKDYRFTKASSNMCPVCNKSLPKNFTDGICPRCYSNNIVLLYDSTKLKKELGKNSKIL